LKAIKAENENTLERATNTGEQFYIFRGKGGLSKTRCTQQIPQKINLM
jgi:hypothetical protein